MYMYMYMYMYILSMGPTAPLNGSCLFMPQLLPLSSLCLRLVISSRAICSAMRQICIYIYIYRERERERCVYIYIYTHISTYTYTYTHDEARLRLLNLPNCYICYECYTYVINCYKGYECPNVIMNVIHIMIVSLFYYVSKCYSSLSGAGTRCLTSIASQTIVEAGYIYIYIERERDIHVYICICICIYI